MVATTDFQSCILHENSPFQVAVWGKLVLGGSKTSHFAITLQRSKLYRFN